MPDDLVTLLSALSSFTHLSLFCTTCLMGNLNTYFLSSGDGERLKGRGCFHSAGGGNPFLHTKNELSILDEGQRQGGTHLSCFCWQMQWTGNLPVWEGLLTELIWDSCMCSLEMWGADTCGLPLTNGCQQRNASPFYSWYRWYWDAFHKLLLQSLLDGTSLPLVLVNLKMHPIQPPSFSVLLLLSFIPAPWNPVPKA